MEQAGTTVGKCRSDGNVVLRYMALYVKGDEYYLNPKDAVRTAL